MTNEMVKKQYDCYKCKKDIVTVVHYCDVCKRAYHPGCTRPHKIKNSRDELVLCKGEFAIIFLKQSEMDDDEHFGRNRDEPHGTCDQMTNEDGAHNTLKRMREDKGLRDQDARDEEKLCQLIQTCISAEVRPLIKKIDALQNQIIESNNEIVSLKQIINTLTSENTLLRKSGNNDQIDSGNCASVSYANVVQKKKAGAVLVVKPVNADVTTQGNVNKNVNLNSIKANISVKELGVGVKSIKEKNNGTVVVKFKNVNDKDKLQKNVVDKIGNQFKVQAPKAQKKFVKIIYIDNDEATLTDEQLVNDIIQQNDLTDCCEKIEMKIVKRIVNDKKKDFNVIVEVNSELQKILLHMEKVSLGWKQCKVIEHVNLIRCFKCCGFNHYANNCKREITCGTINLKCTNCAHNNNKQKKNKDLISDDKHNAYDKKCPIYIKLAESYKKRSDENI